MFIEYNANPFGAYIGDCIIRAITKATGKNYMDVMDGLIDVADARDWEIDEIRTMNVYLLSIGWEYCEINCSPTVFIKLYSQNILLPPIFERFTFSIIINNFIIYNFNVLTIIRIKP